VTGINSTSNSTRAFAATALLLLATAASAQPKSDADLCASITGKPDAAIQHCTRAIESGKYSGEMLSRLHFNRGIEWGTKNDHDRAIADYDAAIQLSPNFTDALYNRGSAWAHKGESDRAIADYDAALMIDSTQADAFNARGELWRKKGERRKALADFGAAIKLNPDHVAAKASHRSLAQELERAGALIAVAGKPSFNCAAARRAVEKAICARPELADLDREVHGSFVRAVREARDSREAKALQREQDEFIARRNAQFGKPGYDLQKAMRERLQRINGVDGY
jgi:tetratricopeptide (TPR) repeat protein